MREKVSIPVGLAVRDWLHFVKRRHTKRTFDHYETVIHKFLPDAPDTIDKLKIEHIEQHIDNLLDKNLRRRSCNSHLTGIMSFTHWISDRYNIQNPSRGMRMLVEEMPKQRVISSEEYQILLDMATGIDRDIIEFVGNTGVRRGEFLALNWQHISSDMRLLKVYGKGRKVRTVPLNYKCKTILKKYERSNEGLPISTRYSKEGTYFMCRRLFTHAKMEPFGLHALRHYFCTALLKKGVSIYKVSKILGHSSVKTTEQIYAHLMPIDLIGCTDILDTE